MTTPNKKAKSKQVKVIICLSEDLLASTDEAAADLEKSRSGLIRDLLMAYLKNRTVEGFV